MRFLDDIEEHEDAYEEARKLAGSVAHSPDELQFLTGLLFCALTVEAQSGLNGITLTFPAVLDAGLLEQRERLISYETMLPTLDERITQKHLRDLAERFRGLAKMLDRI